jgi:outer membrane protein OmpU
MNNFKKIGLTALAASLVSVSANAGEMSVSGSASLGLAGYSGEKVTSGNEYSMGNQLTFSGSGELDNGLTVSLSFVLDQGDDNGTNGTDADSNGGVPFDSHSLKISSDAMGTLTFNGEGGTTTANMIDGSAAGDIWDKFDGLTNAVGLTNAGSVTATATAGNNSFYYSSPELMDGLTIQASFEPQTATEKAGTGLGLTYTGVEGLTVNYAEADATNSTDALSGTSTVMGFSYAIGSFTAAYETMEYDVDTAARDLDMDSMALTYTVNDELSLTYGQEEIKRQGTDTEAKYSGVSAAYTAGGMTISAGMWDAKSAEFDSGSHSDLEKWTLGASFAF